MERSFLSDALQSATRKSRDSAGGGHRPRYAQLDGRMSELIEIIVPRLGWSMEEGAFVAWHKKDGDFVRAGEALFSIEGDKAIQEIESIDSGIVQIAVNGPKPGDSIRVGDVLGHLLSAKQRVPAVVPKAEPPTKPAVAQPA